MRKQSKEDELKMWLRMLDRLKTKDDYEHSLKTFDEFEACGANSSTLFIARQQVNHLLAKRQRIENRIAQLQQETRS